eukprot:8615138-Karenia_brevis.AAC.1
MQGSRAETPHQEDVQYVDACVSEDIEGADDYTADEDEFGAYVELCFDDHMSTIILDESQHKSMTDGAIATLR